MNHRERFDRIMSYQPFDRVPVYYFGTWGETRERWEKEGWKSSSSAHAGGPKRSSPPGLDPDWEDGMWNVHGMVKPGPVSDQPAEIMKETEEYRVVRTPLGAVEKVSKVGSSIPQHLKHALEPSRESWRRFKRFLDPDQPERWSDDWEQKAAELKDRDRLISFLAASLYGWPRDWMGVENISCLAYDDPVLYEEIIDSLTDYFISLYKDILKYVQFDFAYFHEDCCFSSGPLFSPDMYTRFYDRYFRKIISFYRENGVKYMLMDSDGKVDDLLPLWLDSGFDIIFPIEVGTWKADPVKLRKQYGKRLKMMGGVNKHVIPKGQQAVRNELEPLCELVSEGGYIPLPDHRIPPDCSLDDFLGYVEVFKDVFKDCTLKTVV